MKLSEVKKRYREKVGQKIDFDGLYGGQCVDITKDYINQVCEVHFLGNAIDYANKELPIGLKRYKKGEVDIQDGDILVYKFGENDKYGHVAIVESAFKDYSVNFEQNIDGNVDYLINGGKLRVNKRSYDDVVAIIKLPIVRDVQTRHFNSVEENWHFNVAVDELNVRNVPTTKGNEAVAKYTKGEVINYDSYVINDGYVWVSYISDSGVRRYVATGRWENRKNQQDFGNFR